MPLATRMFSDLVSNYDLGLNIAASLALQRASKPPSKFTSKHSAVTGSIKRNIVYFPLFFWFGK